MMDTDKMCFGRRGKRNVTTPCTEQRMGIGIVESESKKRRICRHHETESVGLLVCLCFVLLNCHVPSLDHLRLLEMFFKGSKVNAQNYKRY